MSRCLFSRLFGKKKLKVKFYLFGQARFQADRGQGTWMEEALAPDPNFNRPVKDLVYKDLLTSTFTQTSHDRGIKTWRLTSVCLLW